LDFLTVTSDKGLENTAVADFIISARGPGKVSMIRKERIYYNLFQFMEEQNIMDPLNDSLVAALQYTFSYKINEKLNIWREAWAQHGMRTVHSSP
jgi:hypothetical protein